MIRPPSNQKTYDEFWSGDPAFRQAPPTPDTKDPAVLEQHAKALAEHKRLVKTARELGDWSSILVEGGEHPTKFQMRPIPGHIFRVILDLSNAEAIGPAETNMLILRAALVGVSNLGDVEIRHAVDSAYPKLGMIATAEITNLLDAIDIGIVAELAGTVRDRFMGVSPK